MGVMHPGSWTEGQPTPDQIKDSIYEIFYPEDEERDPNLQEHLDTLDDRQLTMVLYVMDQIKGITDIQIIDAVIAATYIAYKDHPKIIPYVNNSVEHQEYTKSIGRTVIYLLTKNLDEVLGSQDFTLDYLLPWLQAYRNKFNEEFKQ